MDTEPVDIGIPPGKGNGAAGLSPWLFAHLDRNWVRKETTKDLKKLKTPTKRKNEMDQKSKTKNLKKLRMRSALDLIKKPKMDSDDWTKDKNGVIFKTSFKRGSELSDGRKAPHTSKKQKSKISLIQVPRSNFLPNRFTHDEIDMQIIMGKG